MWELNDSTQFLNDSKYAFGNWILCTGWWPSITVRLVVYFFILFSSLAGNVLVVVIFFRNKSFTKTAVNVFIVNMSVSDLMVPAISLPVWIAIVFDKSLLLTKGTLSAVVCRVSWIVWGVSILVSVFSMTVLAVDRFRGIVFPLLKPPLFSRRKLCVTIAAMWLSSITFFVYYAIDLLPIDTTDTFCQDIETTSKKFFIYMTFFALMCLSVVVTTILYAKLTIFLYRENNSLQLASEEVKKRAKRNRKITAMLIIIVILFYVVWIPFHVMMFLSFTNNILFPCVLYWVANYILPIFHPAINPLIYFVFNEKYRRGLKEIFSRDERVRNNECNKKLLPKVASQLGRPENREVNEAVVNVELQEQKSNVELQEQ